MLLFISSSVSAQVTSTQTIYSKSFYGDSTDRYVDSSCKLFHDDCTLLLDGHDHTPIVVNPWESVPINIRCVEIVFLPTSPVSPMTYLFAGNSYSPDPMLWAIPSPTGAAYARSCFPQGTSMAFPAAANSAAANKPGMNNLNLPRLDLHVRGGPSGVGYQAYLTIYYTKVTQ
jgi:hypothetical protein